jgi:hypothetical protein
MIDIHQYTLEEIATALYRKMEDIGHPKGTDKTKWREPVMAEKLGHTAHTKISAGKGKDEYGSDATTQEKKHAEYKSKALSEKDLNNLLERAYGKKKQKNYAPLTISGVYNGYNSNYKTASVEYAKIEHYFGVFYKEKCVLIIKVNTDYVMNTLNANYQAFLKKKSGTTNLNTVSVNLGNTDLYTVAYKDQEFYDSER